MTVVVPPMAAGARSGEVVVGDTVPPKGMSRCVCTSYAAGHDEQAGGIDEGVVCGVDGGRVLSADGGDLLAFDEDVGELGAVRVDDGAVLYQDPMMRSSTLKLLR